MEPNIEIIKGNSVIIMRDMFKDKSKRFECIWLDPPFFDWEEDSIKKPNHNTLCQSTVRLLKPNGVVWLCGTQPQLLNDWIFWKRSFRLVFEIIQYKDSPTPPINMTRPVPTHENIWCLIRLDEKINSTHLDIKKAATGLIKTVKVKDKMRIRYAKAEKGTWTEWKTGANYPRSVFQCIKINKNSKEYVGHPTQKPINLMRVLIKISTNEGDTILDPFAGSGTTLVAANELNRNCIGIELNEKYYEIIRRRLERAKKTGNLSGFL